MTETVNGHSGSCRGFEVTLDETGPNADLFCDPSLLRNLAKSPIIANRSSGIVLDSFFQLSAQ